MYVTRSVPWSALAAGDGARPPLLASVPLARGVAGLMVVAHPQLAYYAYVALAAYALAASGLAGTRVGHSSPTDLPAAWLQWSPRSGVAAVVLLPMYRYLREDSPRAGPGRGFEYSASWSLHAEEALSFFVPEFSGTDVQSETYWGKNPFKHNSEYGGALVLVLGIAAVVGLRVTAGAGGSGQWPPLRLAVRPGGGHPGFPGALHRDSRAQELPGAEPGDLSGDCRRSHSWPHCCSSARSPGTITGARRAMSVGLASGAMACAAAGGHDARGGTGLYGTWTAHLRRGGRGWADRRLRRQCPSARCRGAHRGARSAGPPGVRCSSGAR